MRDRVFTSLTLQELGYQVLDGDRGKSYPNDSDLRKNGDCLFLSAKNVSKSGFNFSQNQFITNTKDNEMRNGRLKTGDFVITTRGSLGHIAYFDALVPFKKVRINSGMAIIRANNLSGCLTDKFLKHCLSAPIIQNQIKKFAFGTAQSQLTLGILHKISIPVPPLPEQKKIAEILSGIDKLIKQTENQKGKLEVLKKGCVNNFISKGIGQKEFKNSVFGLIPIHWQVKKFSEITTSITCGVAATPKYVERVKGIPFLSAQNVQNGEVILDKFKYISREFHLKLIKNIKPEKGDILYSRVGAGYGEAAVVTFNWEFSVYVSLTLIKFKDSISTQFYKYFLNSNYGKKQAKSGVFAGGGVPNLNVGIVKEFYVIVPPQKEQEIIVNQLNSLEININQKKKNISQLKILKKAISSDLLSGRKRVKI